MHLTMGDYLTRELSITKHHGLATQSELLNRKLLIVNGIASIFNRCNRSHRLRKGTKKSRILFHRYIKLSRLVSLGKNENWAETMIGIWAKTNFYLHSVRRCMNFLSTHKINFFSFCIQMPHDYLILYMQCFKHQTNF